MKPVRLVQGFMTVGFWTLLSRILGFAREILLTALIGPGPLMDAFVAAFRLPNMFRRFFAEGAFNAAFVPMFSKKLEGEDDPQKFANDAFNGLALVVMSLTGLAMLFMPALVWATAEGFAEDERFDLTVGYGRVVFPYIVFMSLAALFSGVLNAKGHFAAAAAAPVLLNILAVGAMVLGATLGGEIIHYLIWVIPFAGVCQLGLVWFATEKSGIKIRPGRPKWTSDMSRMITIAVPAALASGVMQINLVVGQLVASRTEGAISWLFAADRLYQLPLGVIGIAIGIVLLPDLSRRLKAGDDIGARDAYSRASEFAMALTLPSAVAFIVIPLPLVSVMYERGATTAADSQAMAYALAIYAVGLPAFVLQKLLQPLYFAREDTKSPFRFAIGSMVVNATLAFMLWPWIDWLAPAVATTAAAWTMVIQLALGARNFGDVARLDARFKIRIWRIAIASGLMAVMLWGTHHLLNEALYSPSWRYIALLFIVLTGSFTYFATGQLCGAFKFSELRRGGR